MGNSYRIFLDANILFSAAKSDGAVRRLIFLLHEAGHVLVADSFVGAEARRNLEMKGGASALDYLNALMSRILVVAVVAPLVENLQTDWLPEKDRPVLRAAIHSRCNILLTGDKQHFGPGFGKLFDGVEVLSPAMLAQRLWPEA